MQATCLLDCTSNPPLAGVDMAITLLVMEIPSNVPMPRFRLFQRVRADDYAGSTYTGTIVGFYWMSSAIAQRLEMDAGWAYHIAPDTGREDASETVYEDDLELLGEDFNHA